MQTGRWSDEATTDLVEVIDYIEQRNALAAQNLHSAIVQSAENLPFMPYLFRPGRVAGLRADNISAGSTTSRGYPNLRDDAATGLGLAALGEQLADFASILWV